MKFLHQNKKELNTKVFSKSNFVVLNYEQLLKVNGAGGGNSAPSGPTGPSSTTTSTTTTTTTNYPSGYGACGGGRYVIDTPSTTTTTNNNPSSNSNPSGYSSCGGGNNSTNSGYSSCGGGSSSSSKIVENSNSGVANANVGDKIVRSDGTVVTLTQADIDWAKSQENKESTKNSSTENTTNTETTTTSETSTTTTTITTSESSTTSSNKSDTSSVPSVTTGSNESSENNNSSVIQKIKNSIKENKNKSYIKGTYQCDDWVQEVLSDAGYDYNDYYAGAAKSTDCEEHISALKKDSYTKEVPTEAGVYIVLMNEGHEYTKKDGTKGILEAHTGILIIGDGNPYFYDNSSGNFDGKGGVEITPPKGGTNPINVMNQFGYDAFYYQKVK